MAVFGVPELHEDDALRAVRAATGAQAALREADIAARIGISTGEVHVLSVPGDTLRVSGSPASVAARLQECAPPGNVLISNDTYVLVRDALRAEQQDDGWLVHELVPGAPAYTRRLDVPLVGRAAELERLRAAYVDARTGTHCRVVTVVGEAGIGKTRLMRELLLPLQTEARVLVGRCVSYGEGATYLPIAEAIRQATRVDSIEGIAELLADQDDSEHVAHRVAELIGLAEARARRGVLGSPTLRRGRRARSARGARPGRHPLGGADTSRSHRVPRRVGGGAGCSSCARRAANCSRAGPPGAARRRPASWSSSHR
jgi:hypothetical protein